MPGSTRSGIKSGGIGSESPSARKRFISPPGSIPVPGTLGRFVLAVTALAFAAGRFGNELALTLLGTIFLTVLAYCFFGVLLLGLLNRRKASLLSLAVSPEIVGAGKRAGLFIRTPGGDPPAENFFRRLPAILVRCEIRLETRDGRVIHHFADPGAENESAFPVRERGAYHSGFHAGNSRLEESGRLLIFDAPGFFHVSIPLHRSGNMALFAVPSPAEELIPLPLKSGGSRERNEPRYRKSDELTDHRPYIPGDDPRRINWKLYGHAHLGELFVREGEPEPPPHSRLLILVDSEIDGGLFSLDEGRRAVDLLCENALAAALDFSGRGMDIRVGSAGNGISGGTEGDGTPNAAELALALAKPAALFPPGENLPRPSPDGTGTGDGSASAGAPADSAVLIFALPRLFAGKGDPGISALDRFLTRPGTNPEADIVFIYDREGERAGDLEEAAVTCVSRYNGRQGIHAVKAAGRRGGGEKTE